MMEARPVCEIHPTASRAMVLKKGQPKLPQSACEGRGDNLACYWMACVFCLLISMDHPPESFFIPCFMNEHD
jgi:hypothetical protein